VCRLAWSGDARVRARTQASLAVSGNGEDWILINASPDLRQQLSQSPVLHPRGETRGSPIKAVVLTGAEIDQATGLLSLREREPFAIYATAATLAAIAGNTMFSALDQVTRHAVVPGEDIALPGGVTAQLFMVPGKVPLYLEGENPETAMESAANVGVEIAAGGARLLFIPGAAGVTTAMRERMARADVLFFDGTLYRDDEMIVSGTGSKTGRRMGHMPIESETLAALARTPARRIFVHINNTNPILVDGSPERLAVERAGWEVAEDGMEIVL
jgi:pyrroloquinoline quinone biosynthesis protein B